MKIKRLLFVFSLISLNTYSQISSGAFSVGGSSASYYPVSFSVSGVDGNSSLGKLSVYIDNVHANGTWSGSFHSDIEFISSNWGHIPTKIVEFTYVTGAGEAYRDPIGDIADGSTARGGSELIMWLKGAATYQWSTTLNSRVTLIDGNPEGTTKTSCSGDALNIRTTQSELVVKAKNTRFYQSVGIGTSGNGYFGGNVGIGTTTPNERLEIVGNLRINNGENCTILPTGHSLTFGGRQDYAHVSYIFRPSWGTPSSTYSNFQLQNATNTGTFTTAVMFTTDGGSSYINSGNFGIGTINPQYKLDVNGELKAGGVQLVAYSPILFSAGDINHGIRYAGSYSNFANALLDGPVMYGYSGGALGVKQGTTETIALRWTGGGNVGIGTQNPAYKLDVLGTIRAKEVLINLDGGADFVFEKDYKLLPIEDVATYVQKNKHLPDILSANEMTRNGVSMGEMQVKLLQKVEELTLYAIEQNKSKKELEGKLAKQESQYNALLEKVETLTKQLEKK